MILGGIAGFVVTVIFCDPQDLSDLAKGVWVGCMCGGLLAAIIVVLAFRNANKKPQADLSIRVSRTIIGKKIIKYPCPACHERLISTVKDCGKQDSCPTCNADFLVPNIP